jgi:prefoldin subunit 5
MKILMMIFVRIIRWHWTIREEKMAKSSYYYSQYKNFKNQADGFNKNKSSLEKIKQTLTDNFYDEQNDVNYLLTALKTNLNNAVRHDNKYYNNCCSCDRNKERTSYSDGKLSNAIIALENEIGSLNQKANTAQQNCDMQYNNYSSAKQDEWQKWLDSLTKKKRR